MSHITDVHDQKDCGQQCSLKDRKSYFIDNPHSYLPLRDLAWYH